jgi:hypothetical protein
MADWKNFYKYQQGPAVANMLYEPLVSADGKVFCMNWNSNKYFMNDIMTEELYEYWFNQEVKYLLKLKNKSYVPEILDIDYSKRKIKFRWYNKSLNWLIVNNQINNIKNWQDQIQNIKQDLEQHRIYKINMYPHTFYFDDKDQAHCMDMYGCTDNDSRYLSIEYLEPLIRTDRFDKFIHNNQLDTHELYNETIKTNYAEWPGDFLNA